MNIHIHNTTKVVQVNGVPARAWEGRTEAGIPVIAFITRIVVERTEDRAEFERDLQKMAQPSADLEAWPARMLVDDEPEGAYDDSTGDGDDPALAAMDGGWSG